ncbi:MAG: hypothetical protein AUG51_05225 [Acidobacteria bacterium 13_1_20CM_3_53_8]|nr:MAG: hypothetical protein AUG51_05225 [Acidobacteria bacterium 13_1_20CM_3_53_8]
MSEDKTTETPDARSFEERVFARFDALDTRLDSVETRLEKLEAKQYDTKPIWERALTEIAEMRQEMRQRYEDFDVRMDRVESVVNATHPEMLTLRADFKEFRGNFKEPA